MTNIKDLNVPEWVKDTLDKIHDHAPTIQDAWEIEALVTFIDELTCERDAVK